MASHRTCAHTSGCPTIIQLEVEGFTVMQPLWLSQLAARRTGRSCADPASLHMKYKEDNKRWLRYFDIACVPSLAFGPRYDGQPFALRRVQFYPTACNQQTTNLSHKNWLCLACTGR